jgi:hypothetical protein
MIAATAGVATLVAGDKRVAWVAGGLILAVSLRWCKSECVRFGRY